MAGASRLTSRCLRVLGGGQRLPLGPGPTSYIFQRSSKTWPGWLAGLQASAFECLEGGRDFQLEGTLDLPPASSRGLIQANFCNPGFLLDTKATEPLMAFLRSLLTPSDPPPTRTAQEVVTELTQSVIGKFLLMIDDNNNDPFPIKIGSTM